MLSIRAAGDENKQWELKNEFVIAQVAGSTSASQSSKKSPRFVRHVVFVF